MYFVSHESIRVGKVVVVLYVLIVVVMFSIADDVPFKNIVVVAICMS